MTLSSTPPTLGQLTSNSSRSPLRLHEVKRLVYYSDSGKVSKVWFTRDSIQMESFVWELTHPDDYKVKENFSNRVSVRHCFLFKSK